MKKILISNDGYHAHYFQRLAWHNAFKSCGHEVYFWDCKKEPAFDVFDRVNPDIFLGQSYNLDRATLKCIKERPWIKVGLRSGDWGSMDEVVDKSKYNILFATQEEKDMLAELKEQTGLPNFVHLHYSQEGIDACHDRYSTIGIDAKPLIMCSDIHVYGNPQYNFQYACDIGFVGGYWPYKGQVIDAYLFPLLREVGEYSVKIFGNQNWPVPQYHGHIDDQYVQTLFASSKICPNLSEPHAQEYGYDINERCFKVLLSGGFCISDNVTSIRNIFENNGVVFAEDPEDFRAKVDYYIDNNDERNEIARTGQQFVMQNHTNFHRIADIFNYLGMEAEAEHAISVLDKIYEQRF